MKKFNITLGSDPEIFIENDVEIVSAEGIVPGTKWEPYPISDEGHSIQLDNIAMEFNIPPCATKEEYVQHINYVKEHLAVLAEAHGYKLSDKASGEINPKYLKTKQAQTFGCEPDFNVWLQDINPSPNSKTNLRCVGGHVHIGIDKGYGTEENLENIVKMFDILVTLPALLIDKDERRRELYGKAGSFRFKDFGKKVAGVECRQLSNFWIHSNELIEWVFEQTVKAVTIVLEGEAKEYIEKYGEIAVEAINTNNKELAKETIEKINKELKTV
jgi:hypothetical protein